MFNHIQEHPDQLNTNYGSRKEKRTNTRRTSKKRPCSSPSFYPFDLLRCSLSGISNIRDDCYYHSIDA